MGSFVNKFFHRDTAVITVKSDRPAVDRLLDKIKRLSPGTEVRTVLQDQWNCRRFTMTAVVYPDYLTANTTHSHVVYVSLVYHHDRDVFEVDFVGFADSDRSCGCEFAEDAAVDLTLAIKS